VHGFTSEQVEQVQNDRQQDSYSEYSFQARAALTNRKSRVSKS